MPTNVDVPSLGESVSEAVLIRWIRNDGDAVAKDEAIALLETDKANVDLPAPAAGVLRQLKKPGDTVGVGEAIAQIEPAGAAAPATAGAPREAKPAAQPAAQPAPATTAL